MGVHHTPLEKAFPPTPDVSSSLDVGAALACRAGGPGSAPVPRRLQSSPSTQWSPCFPVGSGICSLRGFISLESRPAPSRLQTLLCPTWVVGGEYCACQRAQPTLQYQAPPGRASTDTLGQEGPGPCTEALGVLGTLGTLGLVSWAPKPLLPGPWSPAMGSWEQGAVPSGCPPSYLLHPWQSSIHQRRQTPGDMLPAGPGRSHAGPQWTRSRRSCNFCFL